MLIRILKIFTVLLVVLMAVLFFWLNFTWKISQTARNNLNNRPEPETAASASRTELPKEPAAKEVSFIAVGDIMLSRVVGQKMASHQDYNYPFLKTAEYLKTGEIVFGNLETAITAGRRIETGEFSFRSDPETALSLKNNGFTIVSLANNHSTNFGQKGLNDTFKYLSDAGLFFVGAGETLSRASSSVIIEKNGLKFAFLAYDDPAVPGSVAATARSAGINPAAKEGLIKSISQLKDQSDFIIISLHAGIEYTDQPSQFQKNFARAAIDAGADLIIGHHPHWVQSAEVYKGKYIFYSLGNFVFDQMWSEPTREGLVVKFVFTKQGVKSIELKPILIEDYSQPRFLEGERAKRIIERLKLPVE